MNKFLSKKSHVFGLLAVALVAGILIGQLFERNGPSSIVSGPESANQKVTKEQFEPYWEAWNVLSNKYLNSSSTSDQDKIYGSIEGLAQSFGDPYTVFFPPSQSKKFQDDLSGNFSGVGMEIGIRNGQLIVVAPIKDSPASRAGVKSGDYILEINGTSTSNMSVDYAVSLIRGPKGTTVKINFLPKDATKPVERAIVRDIIKIPTLDTIARKDGIFVIKLYSFTQQSASLFRAGLREFIDSGDNKLIIDLRGNPGGYLDQAWEMASFFLPLGKTVVTEDFGSNRDPEIMRSQGQDFFKGYFLKNPNLLILVDGGSASASEILAGALRDHDAAKLVGSKTFGKGSVQELIPLTSDTSLKITIARWLTPSGHNLSHDGLEPDYKVELTEKDITAGKDPVMDKAVEILGGIK
jgi:carboxyl-terminal processing protease